MSATVETRPRRGVFPAPERMLRLYSEYDLATHLQLSGRVRQTISEWTVLRLNNPEVCVADVSRWGSKDRVVEDIKGFSTKFYSFFSPERE
jgi:hypothetical protein